MKILVTGATGFIGSHTALALQRAGHNVRLLVRNRNKLEKLARRHQTSFDDAVIGDVTSPSIVADALRGCDGVVHTAAFVSTSRRDEHQVFATNVDGTRNVIGQAVDMGLARMVHVSSTTAIYDPRATRLTGDEPPADSSSPYGRSKAACERYIRELQAEGHPVSISYPAAVIGPDDPGVTEAHAGLLILLTRTGVITSSGIQMVDARDVADAHCAMLDRLDYPERIPMGGYYYSWRELMATLEELTGRRLLKLPVPGRVLRLLGRGGDLFMRLGGVSTPLNTESMEYATRWVRTDDDKYHRLLGLNYRDHRETLRETLLSLHAAGHVTARQIGRLASG